MENKLSLSLLDVFTLAVKWERLDIMIPKFLILRLLGLVVAPPAIALKNMHETLAFGRKVQGSAETIQ